MYFLTCINRLAIGRHVLQHKHRHVLKACRGESSACKSDGHDFDYSCHSKPFMRHPLYAIKRFCVSTALHWLLSCTGGRLIQLLRWVRYDNMLTFPDAVNVVLLERMNARCYSMPCIRLLWVRWASLLNLIRHTILWHILNWWERSWRRSPVTRHFQLLGGRAPAHRRD